MYTLDKTFLEQEVPALISEGDTLYDAIAPRYADLISYKVDEITSLENYLPTVCGKDVEAVDVENNEDIKRWAVRYAVAQCIPNLDLVATANGFGVVSNNNIAPASRDRVNALRKSLLEMGGYFADRFEALHLYGTNHVPTLFVSTATLSKSVGIVNPDDTTEPLTRETFALTGFERSVGERGLQNFIGKELYDALRTWGVVGTAACITCGFGTTGLEQNKYITPESIQFVQLCFQYIGAVSRTVSPNLKEGAKRYRTIGKQLLAILRDSEGKEWTAPYFGSHTQKAHDFKLYENEASDPTYFFS